jgi:hypothetical protein
MTTIRADAVSDYERDDYVVLPRLLTPERCQSFWSGLRDVPLRRVICGHDAIAWQEQSLGPGMAVYDWLDSAAVRAFVAAALRVDVELRLQAWTSVYAAGEFIDPHRDTTGAVHLLVALDAPPEGHGGMLVLHHARGEVQLALQAGDGVLFNARGIEHCTTPLRRSAAVPSPTRVVAVGRYHLPIA